MGFSETNGWACIATKSEGEKKEMLAQCVIVGRQRTNEVSDALTYSVPAALDGNGGPICNHGISRNLGPEVWPCLHKVRIAIRVAESKGIIVIGRVGDVQGAGGSVSPIIGIQKGEDILRLVIVKSVRGSHV
jgi:hypothetical protein